MGYLIGENDLHTLDGAYAHLCQTTGLSGQNLGLIADIWTAAKKHEAFLDELWAMGKDAKTEKERRDLSQNMLNKIREFSKNGKV